MQISDLLHQANQTWDVEAITNAISKYKEQKSLSVQLTTNEQIILCALLCKCDRETIHSQLSGISKQNTFELIQKIQEYLKHIAIRKLRIAYDGTYDTLTLLALSGYRKSTASIIIDSRSIEIDKYINTSNHEITKGKLQVSNTVSTIIKEASSNSKTSQSSIIRNSQSSRNYLANSVSNELLPTNAEIAASVDEFSTLSIWNKVGSLLTLGLVTIGITLASTMKYDVTVKADSVVRPKGKIKLVQAAIEGTVKNIEVKNNQLVRKNQVLATLDNTELKQEKSKITHNIAQTQLKINQIRKQIELLELQIISENIKSDRIIAGKQAELENARIEFHEKQVIGRSQIVEANAQLNIAQHNLIKSQADLTSLMANLKSTQASLASAISKKNRYQKIMAVGAITREVFEESKLALIQQEQNLASDQAKLLAQKKTIEERKEQIKIAESQLIRSQKSSNANNSIIVVAEEAIAREIANKNSLTTSYNREKSNLLEQKIEAEKQLLQDKSILKQIDKKIEQTILRATVDGKILNLNLSNPGQVITAQDTIVTIVPENVDLVVKATVDPRERNRILPGQKVNLKIQACPYPDYGVLQGVVTNISGDTLTSSDKSGEHYLVDIKPQNTFLYSGKRACHLDAGMPVKASIITRAETPLQFLLRKVRLLSDI